MTANKEALHTVQGSLLPLNKDLNSERQELDAKRQELDQPLWAELSQLSAHECAELQTIAAPLRERGKVALEIMHTVLLNLCDNRYLGLRLLAELLNREAETLRRRVLNPMVSQGLLRRAFPRPNDPRQAYTSNNTSVTHGNSIA